MKIFLAATLIVGLAFTGFCGTTNETNGAAQTQQEQLFTRAFKIDNETFGKNLTHLAGFKEGESQYQMLLRFFKQNDVTIERPTTLFWSHNNGLYFHATQTDLNKIEKLVMAIQNDVPPSEIHN
jgi:hypothetical protein